MDDLISRQALCEYALNQKDESVTLNDIMRFPSAQPERIRGRWEKWPRQLVPHNTIWWYVCSACGGKAIDGGVLTNFCPNCGADMR